MSRDGSRTKDSRLTVPTQTEYGQSTSSYTTRDTPPNVPIQSGYGQSASSYTTREQAPVVPTQSGYGQHTGSSGTNNPGRTLSVRTGYGQSSNSYSGTVPPLEGYTSPFKYDDPKRLDSRGPSRADAASRSTSESSVPIYPGSLQYKPLDVEKLEVRFLKFVPHDLDGPIRCTLHTVSLLSRPVYYALSYCWGTDKPTASIITDRHQFPVSKNLKEALRQVRTKHRGEDFYLWVDAICIDQANKDEKTRQISFMNRIFGRATMVYGWLGVKSEHSAITVGLLSALTTTTGLGKDLNEHVLAATRMCLIPLSKNPYWRRAWIVQETATPANLVLLWGNLELSWNDLVTASKSTEFEEVCRGHEIRGIATLEAFRTQEQGVYRSGARASLLDALVDIRAFEATEPRDKIFALLNLTSDGRDILPFPNYTEPLSQVLIDVASAVIVRQGKLAAVFFACRSRRPSMDIPSWVPDWTQLQCLHSWVVNAVKVAPSAPESLQLSQQEGQLRFQCQKCDVISIVMPTGPLASVLSTEIKPSQLRRVLNDLKYQLGNGHTYARFEEANWLNWFTILADIIDYPERGDNTLAHYSLVSKWLNGKGHILQDIPGIQQLLCTDFQALITLKLSLDRYEKQWVSGGADSTNIFVESDVRIGYTTNRSFCVLFEESRPGDELITWAGCPLHAVVRQIGKKATPNTNTTEIQHKFIGGAILSSSDEDDDDGRYRQGTRKRSRRGNKSETINIILV